VQLVRNEMEVYLVGDMPLGSDSCNLFALRSDLYIGQFDQAQFVIVPKSGQFVVHFLRRSEESAQQYHNTIFDHKCALSHELLYARFAWALMKIVSMKDLDAKKFKFSDNDGDSNGGTAGGAKGRHGCGSKRQRRNSDVGGETDGDDSDTCFMHGPGESTVPRHSEADPPDGNAFC
jgi:hypothetical protein